MDITVYNDKFEVIFILDTYESLLWVDRYSKEGEFEIYTPVTEDIVNNLKPDNYITIKDSEHMMIIEDITIETDVEDGDHIKIVGRSLESILDRRIIWGEDHIQGNLQNSIRRLITNNIITPSITDRKISNFIFEDSTDTKVTELTYEGDYEGEDLLKIISDICTEKEIGFSILLDDQNRFVFKLYAGTDRSYAQDDLPWVVFRPDFDNVGKTNYNENHSNYKTVTLISGELDNSSYYTVEDTTATYVPESRTTPVKRVVGSGSGLLRKEIYTSATDVRQEDGMSDSEFYALLDSRGTETLKEHNIKKTFDGEYETKRMFIYKRDFFMGDIIQVANEYGMEAPSRITEFIYSQDSNGYKSYPTFTALDYPEE